MPEAGVSVDISAPPIRGIIFDLDGTLYRMRWFMKPLMTLFTLHSPARLPAYMKVRKQFAGKDLGTGEALTTAMAHAMKGNEKKNLRWITEGFYRIFLPVISFQKGSRPGLNSLLADLAGKGIKTAVLSDFAKIPERLDILGIDRTHITATLSSESEGALKPSPRPFIKAAELLGIPPENILVVGDRDDTDGAGARSAGMRFFMIADGEKAAGCSWHETAALLASLSSQGLTE